VVASRKWLAAPDCCDLCQEMDGVTTGLDEPYADGIDGVPLHPQCRCNELPMLLEDDGEKLAKADQARDEKGRWASTGAALIDAAAQARPGAAFQKHDAGSFDVAAVAKATGHNLDGFRPVVDTHAMWHVLKMHGGAAEAKRGQKSISASDFAHIPSILSAPDSISGAGLTRIGREAVAFEKSLEGWHFRAVMEIRTGRKELALVSMRTNGKAKPPTSA
jgi:hypothetical protein